VTSQLLFFRAPFIPNSNSRFLFASGIGGTRENGQLRHDGRAPDYDDWVTQRPDGGHGKSTE